MGAKVNNATKQRAAQKMKGNPGCTLAKLLPRGGEITPPTWAMVKIIPKAVPEYIGLTPSVSSNMVTLIAIKPSIKTPDTIIKNHTEMPSTKGKKPKQKMVTISNRLMTLIEKATYYQFNSILETLTLVKNRLL